MVMEGESLEVMASGVGKAGAAEQAALTRLADHRTAAEDAQVREVLPSCCTGTPRRLDSLAMACAAKGTVEHDVASLEVMARGAGAAGAAEQAALTMERPSRRPIDYAEDDDQVREWIEASDEDMLPSTRGHDDGMAAVEGQAVAAARPRRRRRHRTAWKLAQAEQQRQVAGCEALAPSPPRTATRLQRGQARLGHEDRPAGHRGPGVQAAAHQEDAEREDGGCGGREGARGARRGLGEPQPKPASG